MSLRLRARWRVGNRDEILFLREDWWRKLLGWLALSRLSEAMTRK